MPRYIDADALIANLDKALLLARTNEEIADLKLCKEIVRSAPTVSPDEVRGKGKWIERADEKMCDYESVAKSLQCCASDSEPCEHCNCELGECNPKTIMEIAADAIEELQARNDKQTMMIRKQSERTKELLSAVPKWISVKESLPEKGKPVLVYGKRGGIYTALYKGGRYWWKLNSKSHSCEPTHWMPLPEPPKEE